jgi:hypothetical protein
MAVITVILMTDPFPKDHFIGQFIGVRPFRNGGVGINGEPDENRSADDRAPNKEISCTLFPHKKPPFYNSLKFIRFLITR